MKEVTEAEIRYFNQLDERQQRLYAGLQAKLIGWHGVKSVSSTYGIDVKTVRKGKVELIDLPDVPVKSIRKSGGCPKKKKKFMLTGLWLLIP